MSAYPEPAWSDFYSDFSRQWKQGEHIFISAQTGAGKTELLTKIMPIRDYRVIFITKPRDPIFRAPEVSDYTRQREFDPRPWTKGILLGPRSGATTGATRSEQQRVFASALDQIYHDRNWCVGIDELAYMGEFMGLDDPIKILHHMGRAYGISVVSATQRPFRIPIIVPESASHAFIGKTGRPEDLRRVAAIYPDPKEAQRAIASLRGKHDFVYLNANADSPIKVINTRR